MIDTFIVVVREHNVVFGVWAGFFFFCGLLLGACVTFLFMAGEKMDEKLMP